MEISISTGLYYTKGYEEILDIIQKTSCKNIELFLNQAFIDVKIEELKEEINKRDLKVCSIHTPLEFIAFERKENEKYWIEKSIEMAKKLNAKLIVSHMVLGDNFEKLNKSLDQIHRENMIKAKEYKDIIITTENLPNFEGGSFLGRRDEFKSFIEENNIHITFDTTHAAASGENIIEKFNGLKNHVRNIHLSDFKDGAEHKVLGTGNLPLEKFIENLKKENYNGFVTIELDFDNKGRNDIKNNEEAISEIQKSIDFINKIIE